MIQSKWKFKGTTQYIPNIYHALFSRHIVTTKWLYGRIRTRICFLCLLLGTACVLVWREFHLQSSCRCSGNLGISRTEDLSKMVSLLGHVIVAGLCKNLNYFHSIRLFILNSMCLFVKVGFYSCIEQGHVLCVKWQCIVCSYISRRNVMVMTYRHLHNWYGGVVATTAV
jgi:hypothetical protein